jgi:hypothetical protein
MMSTTTNPKTAFSVEGRRLLSLLDRIGGKHIKPEFRRPIVLVAALAGTQRIDPGMSDAERLDFLESIVLDFGVEVHGQTGYVIDWADDLLREVASLNPGDELRDFAI